MAAVFQYGFYRDRAYEGTALKSTPQHILKLGSLGWILNSKIQLLDNSRTLSKMGVIKGKLFVINYRDITHHGIRIQLEGTLNLEFKTKLFIQIQSVVRKKEVSIIAGASEPRNRDYSFSPIRTQIIGVRDKNDRSCTKMNHSLMRGQFTYPFTIQMTNEALPSCFKCQYGSLEYKIVAYMRSPDCYIKIGETQMIFVGQNYLQPETMIPIRSGLNENGDSNSMVPSVIFTTEKSGFLPGEDIEFVINVINLKQLIVSKVKVVLWRRLIYNAKGRENIKNFPLSSYETNEIREDGKLLGKVLIPKYSIPSYDVIEEYKVIYLLEYQVELEKSAEKLNGQVQIIIGTSRDLIHGQMNSLQIEDTISETLEMAGQGGERWDSLTWDRSLIQNFQNFSEQFPRGNRFDRSNSVLSGLSEVSAASVPPAYSQISSRSMSILSIETLPPHYEDLSERE